MNDIEFSGEPTIEIEDGVFSPYLPFQNGHTVLEFDPAKLDSQEVFDSIEIKAPDNIEIRQLTRDEITAGPEMLDGKEVDKSLRIMRLNRGTGKKMLVGLSWSETFDSEGTMHKLAILATLLPEFELVAVEKLGVGESSDPDKEDDKEMRRKGSFVPHGRTEAQILDENDQQFDAVYGGSMGSRFALGYVANTKNAPKHVILEDPLGAKKFKFKDFAVDRFMGLEGSYTKDQYMQTATDETAVEIWERGNSPMAAVRAFGKWAVTGKLHQYFYTQIQAMRKPGLLTDMRFAMNNLPEDAKVNVIIPTASAVTDAMATADVALSAAKISDNDHPPTAKVYLMPGASHAHTQANSANEAMMIRHCLGLDADKTLAA